MLDKTSSFRLRLLRFPLIVGIVFVHSHGSTVTIGGAKVGLELTSPFVTFVRDIISQGLAQACVPLLFLIAGFLFWQGFDGGLQAWRRKLRSRVDSLLLPYLLWNGAALALFWALPQWPAAGPYFPASMSAQHYDGLELLRAWLGWGRAPVLGQFWFLRDLMLMMLLAPLIHALNSPRWPWFAAALAAACLAGLGPEQLLWFGLGAYLQRLEKGLFFLDPQADALALAYGAVLVVDAFSQGEAWNGTWHLASTFLALPAVLGATRRISPNSRLARLLVWLSPSSFFVFAAHWLALALAQKAAFKLVQPSSSSAILGLYFAVPLATLSLLVLLYEAGVRCAPRTMSLWCGGRDRPTPEKGAAI